MQRVSDELCSLAEFCDVLLSRAEHTLTPFATRILQAQREEHCFFS